MKRSLLLLGSTLGFFGVALGAFGAHGLKSILAPDMLVIFETAVRYHMYHVFAIILTALLAERNPAAGTAGRLFGLGILLFSGSLYVLALTGIRTFGMITPFGGLSFLAGWGMLATAAFKMKKEG
ncbi:MAG: DUF423 domain-containing protein [Bacteroidetes bacterium]|nr:DUF423 domain-containing protein [Bacteroidota bacterium]